MTAILAATLKSAVPLLLALCVMPMLRRQSAALRHLVLTTAIGAALLAPLAGLVLPSWSLPPRLTAPLLAVDQAVSADPVTVAPSRPPVVPVTFVERAAATTVTTWRIAGLVWLLGAAISVFVLICGLVRIAWLVRRATPVSDPVWTATAAVVSRRIGLRKPVRLLETRHSTLLVTVGIVRPSLLVPTAALTWTRDRVAVVLEHELAHVARRDWIVQVMAELVRAWHWFNPAAWAVCARLRQESEQASDDRVLAGGVDGVAYAEHLVTIARELRATRQWLPALSMAQPSGFERRIRMLITPVNRRPLSRTTAFAVAIAALVITVPLAAAAMQAAARVTGSVADPQSGLLPDVVMVLTNTATHERREIRSDRSGRFEFASLDAGDYLLEARLPGFDAFTSKLTVVNGTVQQDLKLDHRRRAGDDYAARVAVPRRVSACAGATGRRDVPAARRDQAETRRAAMHHRAGALGAVHRRQHPRPNQTQGRQAGVSRVDAHGGQIGDRDSERANQQGRTARRYLATLVAGPRVHRRGHPGGQPLGVRWDAAELHAAVGPHGHSREFRPRAVTLRNSVRGCRALTRHGA